MIIYLALLFSEVLLLYFLSRKVQRKIGSFLYRIAKNKKTAVYAMSLLFLPGTFIHEISHFLAALFLFVPVGNMQLTPIIKDQSIELGSVSIAKTDFIRSFFISVAPLFVGNALILFTVYLALTNQWYENVWILIVISYFIFTIANTMFISKKDVQGTLGFIFFIILVIIIVLLLGLNISFSLSNNSEIVGIISKLSLFLVIPTLLDLLILAIIK